MEKTAHGRNTGKYRSTVLAEHKNKAVLTTKEKIAMLRLSNHLSQKDVAEHLGTSQRAYCRYELGQTKIPLERLVALSRLYGVSMDYLSGTSDQMKKGRTTAPVEK